MKGDILFWFWLSFSWWKVMLSAFSSTFWPFVCFLLKKCLFSSFVHLKIRIICFLLLSYRRSLCFLNTIPPKMYGLQIPCSILYVAFHFLDCFPHWGEAFQFHVTPLVYFCFYYLWYWCSFQEIIAIANVKKIFPCIFLKEFHGLRS